MIWKADNEKTRKIEILKPPEFRKNFYNAKKENLIKIGRIELIRNDLGSGERDLSIGDIGIRVCDLKYDFGLGFRI